jgi:hypothetical protein
MLGIAPTRWAALIVFALAVVALGDMAALTSHHAARANTAPAVQSGVSVTTTTAPAEASTTTPAGVASHTPAVRATSRPVATTTTTISTVLDAFPVMSKGYAYDLSLTPTCARPGQVFTAVMHLKPKFGSEGDMLPFYSDGSHEDGTGQIAQSDGTITYHWVAKAVAGEGRLVTQGRDADTGQDGTKIVAFRIVEANESC